MNGASSGPVVIESRTSAESSPMHGESTCLLTPKGKFVWRSKDNKRLNKSSNEIKCTGITGLEPRTSNVSPVGNGIERTLETDIF